MTPRKGAPRYDWLLKPKNDAQKHIEKMKVFEVVDGKEASGSKVIRTRLVVTNKGTPDI